MRWIFRIIGVVVVLVVLAVAVVFLLPADRIAGVVTDRFQAATGRAMVLEGDVRPTLWPTLGVRTGAVEIANADWSDAGPMFKAQGLAVAVDMAGLLDGDINIKRVEAIAPEITLEIAADGRANWEFDSLAGGDAGSSDAGSGDAGQIATNSGSSRAISLGQAVITDAALTFIDHGTGTRTAVENVQIEASLPDMAGPLEAAVSGRMNGQDFAVTATVAALADLMGAKPTAVLADVVTGASKLGFDGRLSLTPLAVAGAVDIDLPDAAVFTLAGIPAPAIPEGFGQQIGLRGDLTYTEAGVALRGAEIRLDQNRVAGDVDVALSGDRPAITANLTAGDLDFAAALASDGTGGESSGAAPAAGATGWPKDPIDVSGMQAIDADISFAANSIDLGLLKLGKTRVLSALVEGRAVTELKELAAYEGGFTGSFVVNSRGGLSARFNLTGSNVAIGPLMTDLAGYDRVQATGDLAVNLLAVGNSVDALMHSLDGDGSLSLGKGEMRGLDLAGMLRNLDPNYVGEGHRTIFDGISGSYTITDGVLRNEDFALTAPLLSASGAGTVGLGAQTQDYQLVPALLPGQERGGLKVPLQITGSWADPKFGLDLEALAKQELADDLERVKDQAEQAVRDRVANELGVDANDVENAVQDRLQQELGIDPGAAGNLLNNLLGGGN